MKVLNIGILSQEQARERLLAIARGEHKPKASEPKIWFTSLSSLEEALCDESKALHKEIKR